VFSNIWTTSVVDRIVIGHEVSEVSRRRIGSPNLGAKS
jgi:hypothetical protein